jgi:hypothetical protein
MYPASASKRYREVYPIHFACIDWAFEDARKGAIGSSKSYSLLICNRSLALNEENGVLVSADENDMTSLEFGECSSKPRA